MAQPKRIRCPVHGYIDVPQQLFPDLIDSPVFQRLRDIRQTTMRPLFPSAEHCRFVHSLGVFHLATTALEAIAKNTPRDVLAAVDLDSLAASFPIAALFHDCGHAPFSHVLEEFYDTDNRAQKRLIQLVAADDPTFAEDLRQRTGSLAGPKAHEIFSAIIFLTTFAEPVRRVSSAVDPFLVARMITGCPHHKPDSQREEAENCFIGLVNGQAIDVDKLDYLVRDTWASGVKNVGIDTPRLLGALRLGYHKGVMVPVFDRQAISVIQSVVAARHYLHRWVLNHHVVLYYRVLLRTAVTNLLNVMSEGKSITYAVDCLFGEEAFHRPASLGDFRVYVPSDADILWLLKQHADKIPEVAELLSRRPARVPLWKGGSEFSLHFEGVGRDVLAALERHVPDVLQAAGLPHEKVIHMRAQFEQAPVDWNELFVAVAGQVVPFSRAVPDVASDPAPQGAKSTRSGDSQELVDCFYVYIPRSEQDKIHQYVTALRNAAALLAKP